jgi:hypothetical protein
VAGATTREAADPVVHPPATQSLARGLAVVGRSPALLASGFLSVLGLWAAFSAYATLLAAVPPGLMVLFESLPPLRSLVVDYSLLAAGRTAPAAVALAFAVALVLYRAAFSALWITLMLEALEVRDGPPATGRWPEMNTALRRAARRLPSMIGIELGFLTLGMVSLLVAGTFLGSGFGQLAVMATLIGGMYFFVYAPVIAVAEEAPPLSAARLAIRAARIPGPRHLVMTVGYIALSLLVSQLAPSSRLASATPSISVWAYVLFVNFLHLSAQAAVAYRWHSVRRSVLDRHGVQAGRARRPS